MEKRMKNRLALLSILLIAGILMAGIGAALGAGDLLKFAGKQVSASVMTNENGMDVVTIREDGKVVKEFTLPEESEYTLEVEDGKLIIGKMPTKEEMEKRQAESIKDMNKWLEIANKDSRVQELTNGKGIQYKEGEGYNVICTTYANEEAILSVNNIEGKYYKITIDLNSETVKSIEEQSSIRCPKLPLIDCNEVQKKAIPHLCK